MKILFSLFLILVFATAGYNQEKHKNPKTFDIEKPKQGYELFELSSKFRFPNPDGIVFSDSLRHLPGQISATSLPENYFFAQSTMPVVKPGPEFLSNMPVMVPNTSVHYFILNKRIKLLNPKPEVKK